MKYKITWSDNALKDMMDILNFIKSRSGNEIAKNIFNKIQDQFIKISDFPNCQRIVPELKDIGITEIKECIESPWRIFYRVTSDEIRILSIIDGRRNVEELLYKKILDGKLT
jgi:toxin ParE1/3/4